MQARRIPVDFFDGVQNSTQVSDLLFLTSSYSDLCALSPLQYVVPTHK
jgi:hypothetical protein